MHVKEIHLKRRPVGMPVEADFAAVTRELGPRAPGMVRVRNRFCSVDPYMRGRMIDRPGYAAPFALNAVIPGRTIGEVIESDDPILKQGAFVRSMSGWCEAFDAEPEAIEFLDPGPLPVETYIGVAGVPGLTAYAGLTRVAQMKPGETVFVSAAAGAVGQVAVQVARILGARVIGSAGGEEKCAFVKSLGADAVIDYRAETDMTQALLRAAPGGIDIYFDNVGGDTLEAAITALKSFGRIAICGMISQYNAQGPVAGPRNLALLVGKSARMEGFLASTHMDLMPEFVAMMQRWIPDGAVQYRHTIHDGLDHAPAAFISLFTGANFGKPLLKV